MPKTSPTALPTPFLQVVARHYSSCSNLMDYCFVFPNRRSGKFFLHFLKQEVGNSVTIAPQVTTITDFESEISHRVTVSPIKAMFELYHAYEAVALEHGFEPDGFDHFLFWGNIILRDFSDVDNYMVNAQEIFTNTRQLRNISTDYLSDDLKQLIEKYFRVNFDHSTNDGDDSFWKHTSADDSVKGKYLKLWEILYPIYEKFNAQLDAKGLCTAGKMAKDTATIIKALGADEFNCKKYVFVGFSTLSTSEMSIFDLMLKKGIAEFCWDYNSPAFADKENKATHFMDIYTRHFKTAIPEEEPITNFPANITVIGVPSNAGQAKYAFKVVEELIANGQIANCANAIDTAIVLPDEKLFTPLINSVPDSMLGSKINVTLGYPLRSSSIVSLMRIIAKVHSQASVRTVGTEKIITYFKDHVIDALSHPIIKSLFPTESTSLISKIDNTPEWSFNIPESAFTPYSFGGLFKSIRRTNDLKNDCSQAIDYIMRLKDFAILVQQRFRPDTPFEGEFAEDAPQPLQAAFIDQYIDALNDLISALSQERGLSLSDMSVFYLIDRLTGMGLIPFQGEPLGGLQIMGMLETRCIDFKNLVILSVNERVYPRKFFSSSFIPLNVRRAYRMSTTEHQESMVAYYFYRLISRAQNVYLLHDSSTRGLGSGEYSRFVSQLQKVFNCKINFRQLLMTVQPSNSLNIEVEKTGYAANKISRYTEADSGAYLSASSIKELLKCPLKFYFHHIERLNDDNKDSEFMDAATFGTIVHDILQHFYYPDATGNDHIVNPQPHRVNRADIDLFIKRDLKRQIVENINRTYLHKTQIGTPLTGETAIVYEGMKIYLLKCLDYDRSLLPGEDDYIEVIECEQDHKVRIDPGHGCPPFNFDYRIDRMDRVVTSGKPGPLRIIDYKTGKDKTEAKSVEALFTPNTEDLLAIMQLMLYCNAYAQERGYKDAIQPIIYKLRDMSNPVIKIGAKSKNKDKPDENVVADYRVHNEEFMGQLASHLREFFSTEARLTQCADGRNAPCKYCNFIDFCRRTVEEE